MGRDVSVSTQDKTLVFCSGNANNPDRADSNFISGLDAVARKVKKMEYLRSILDIKILVEYGGIGQMKGDITCRSIDYLKSYTY